eukprot:2484739-Pleurochrysis_carterae.AAC.2
MLPLTRADLHSASDWRLRSTTIDIYGLWSMRQRVHEHHIETEYRLTSYEIRYPTGEMISADRMYIDINVCIPPISKDDIGSKLIVPA